jgi:hypothetical protein
MNLFLIAVFADILGTKITVPLVVQKPLATSRGTLSDQLDFDLLILNRTVDTVTHQKVMIIIVQLMNLWRSGVSSGPLGNRFILRSQVANERQRMKQLLI